MAFGMGSVTLVFQLILAVVTIPISALLLMLSTKFFKGSDQSYMTALKTAAVTGIAGLVLSAIGALNLGLALVMGVLNFILVGILLSLWLVKTFYSLDWKTAALVWLVWFVLGLVAGFIIALILGVILVAIGLSALKAGGGAMMGGLTG